MSDRPAFRLFERFGVELEYMIVDARSLDVLPVTDRVLHAVAGEYLRKSNWARSPGRTSWRCT
jgi:glutamate---cysteine ligase / carboxylate-amine ligase